MGRELTLGNPPIAVAIRQSAQARQMSLRVSRLDGKVSLTLPPRASDREALAFLSSREDWLRKHLSQVAGPQPVVEGASIPFRGAPLTIRLGAVKRPHLTDDSLILPQTTRAIGPKVQAVLKHHARDVLADRSDHYAALVGRRYEKLSLRDTRSRWGSCSSKGVLMYSWRLIMAPPAVLDYVAAHEVAHLVEMNHSAAFWTVVAGLMPDYAAHRGWLRAHGTDLHRVQFD